MTRGRTGEGVIKDGRTLPIFIHSSIDDLTELSPNAMRVYMHLSRRADKTGTAWPSYQKIGDHCFTSVYKHADSRRRHAIAAVKELIQARLLSKESRRDAHGQQSNVYTLHDPVTVASQPVGIIQSQPVVTVESQPEVTVASQRPVIEASLPPVTVESPEGTPLEDTPKKGSPKGSVGAGAPTPPISVLQDEFVLALCEICYGHREPQMLTESKRGALAGEAGRMTRAGFGVGELARWFDSYQANDWRWRRDRERPKPHEVRERLPEVRARYALDVIEATQEVAAPAAAPPAKVPSMEAAPPDVWTQVCTELLAGRSPDSREQLEQWLAGSELVKVDEIGDMPLYQVWLADPEGVSWVHNRLAVAIRRTLTSIVHKRVMVEVCNHPQSLSPISVEAGQQGG